MMYIYIYDISIILNASVTMASHRRQVTPEVAEVEPSEPDLEGGWQTESEDESMEHLKQIGCWAFIEGVILRHNAIEYDVICI